ncbi:carbohydrate ABC transporter permease [Paenibacillus eucommiae]|uniref:Aldouronate transport system permease protein n=1 Tax=Paenibacillus eucommiae TaxID=1355755 RepID=A0ABS4J1T0_9BACL|nr:carbohydrate ABC transporter permease [Paenibacillus eucommiae]MBP1993777.1 putative aldouronate transport system permease protein [Paenibacillus eucommiae]
MQTRFHLTWGSRLFNVVNYTFLIALSLLCVLPMVHILAVSFSSSSAASAGLVTLWPIDITTKSYSFILSNQKFLNAMVITLERVLLGTTLSMLLIVITAYPLSKENASLKFRTVYAWFFVLTILFSGGLIPWYMTIKYVGIMDTIWALILPGAVPVFSVILLLNFFRSLPKELEESSFMDGAGYWTVLWRIYAPLSLPALATVGLFTIVGHWNSWFDGIILMNSPDNYPLASFLQKVIVGVNMDLLSSQDIQTLSVISDRTTRAAQIFVGALPVLLVYPFLQRFFMKGLILGSVKE